MIEKLETLSKIIAAILIPVMIAYMGNRISESNSRRDAQTHLVELAIEILNKDPNGKNTAEEKILKDWAIKVVDTYSGVPLPKELKAAIVDNKVKLTTAAEQTATWAVIFGADKSLKEAQYEISQANKRGYPTGQIFLRAGSYRSVIIASNRAEAEELLGRLKNYRESSYLVNMEKWCPNTVSQPSYFDCLLT
jgi:hypothetical protein